MKKILILIYISIIISGCSWVADTPRTMWGSSVRVLSDKRVEAESETFSCNRDRCFDIVSNMTYSFGSKKDTDVEKFLLFAEDLNKEYLIVMGVPGSVDTTEVGVFFDELPGQSTKVEVSSLSSRAKKTAADMIFETLSQLCGK